MSEYSRERTQAEFFYDKKYGHILTELKNVT